MTNPAELFFNRIADGSDMDQLTRTAVYEVFHNPIMITNHAFRVLSLITPTDIDDPVWKQAQTYGSFTEEYIKVFKDSDNAKVVMEQKKPLLYNKDLGQEVPRIICPILHNRRVIGLITVIGWVHPVTEEDMANIVTFAKAVSILLRPNENNPEQSMGLTNFLLRSFLEGNSRIAILPEEKLFYENRNHYIYVSRLPADEISKGYISYLQDTMEKIDTDIHAFPFEEMFFVLYSGSNTKKYSHIHTKIVSLLRQFHLYTAISSPFSDLMEVRMHYRLACEAIIVGRILSPEQTIYRVNDLMDYLFIARSTPQQLKPMITPEYRKLSRYDAHNGGELVLTIAAYYETGFNVSLTSKRLNVHRNTVAYRLEMIKERMDIDITDVRILHGICLSMKIETWLNKQIPEQEKAEDAH